MRSALGQDRGDGKPETFNFLGFTHACSQTRKGRLTVLRQTIRQRWQAKLREQMLALVAALAMGRLSRKAAQGGPVTPASTAGLGGMLGSLLDSNRDGSVLDDVAGLAGGLLKGR